MYINMTALDIYKSRSTKPIKLVERSLLSSRWDIKFIFGLFKNHIHVGRHCFLENLRTTGVIEPAMASVLDEWYKRADEDRWSKPHAIGKNVNATTMHPITINESLYSLHSNDPRNGSRSNAESSTRRGSYCEFGVPNSIASIAWNVATSWGVRHTGIYIQSVL